STVQRRVVFRLDEAGTVDLAVRAASLCKELAERTRTEVVLEYSPESFHGTELEFALEICEAVMDVWRPSTQEPMIINLKAIVEECNELPIHPRHPWVGELVYTAFSGSHQDAIKKGMYAQQRESSELWDVPYLPIDPADLGRSYEAIIRVNSQSGKGGVAYLMETEHSLELPRG